MNSTKAKPINRKTLPVKFILEPDKATGYLDIADVMIIVLDKKGIVKFVNKKTCELLGYPKDQIIGKNWFKNFVPEHYSLKIEESFKMLMKGKEPEMYYENNILTSDMTERLVLWHTSISKDSEGNIDGIVSSGEDITENRKLQNELIVQSRNSEFMYLISRAISDTTDLADLLRKAANILMEYPGLLGGRIYIFPENNSFRVSNQIEYGDFSKIIKQNIDLNESAYIINLLESKINCIENFEYNADRIIHKAVSCAYKMNTKNDTHGLFVVLSESIDSNLNDFLMLVSAELGRAIKRKKVEIAIKESEEKFTSIFNFMPDALSISDIENSNYLAVNKGFEELTGYSKEEVVNQSAYAIKTWINSAQRKELVKKVAEEGKVTGFLTTIKKKDNSHFDALFSAALINLNGTKCMLASVRDIENSASDGKCI